MASKTRNKKKKYRPKPVQRIPKIDGWVHLGNSGYKYRKSHEQSFFRATDTFCADLYRYHVPESPIEYNERYEDLTDLEQRWYKLLQRDFEQGIVDYEFTEYLE